MTSLKNFRAYEILNIKNKIDYPYFETRFFTKENLLKILDKNSTSPPFYGNFMTFFCRKG